MIFFLNTGLIEVQYGFIDIIEGNENSDLYYGTAISDDDFYYTNDTIFDEYVSEIKKEILNSNRHLIFIIFIALFSIILLLSPFILRMRFEKKKNIQPFHEVRYANVINSQQILSMPESSIISRFQILNNKYFANSKILKG
jgi:hypothetical protein